MPLKFQPIVPRKMTRPTIQRLSRELTSLMGDLVTEAYDELAQYPAPPAGSEYRRTGTLGRSWQHRVRVSADQIEGTVASQGQIAPYNIYVQGARQARIHRARWKTARQVIERLWPGWVKRVQAAFQRAASQI